jgi:hypothetical protein
MRVCLALATTIATLTAAVVIAAVTAPVAAKTLRSYQDERFGTVAAVPPDWRRLPPDERWHGARFVSPDGTSWLAIYAAPDGAAPGRDSVEAHMDATTRAAGESITLLVRRPGWLVVSGTKGDRVFYRKAVLSCDTREAVWHHIALEYPAQMKRTYDPLVAVVSRSLEPGQENCGWKGARRDER